MRFQIMAMYLSGDTVAASLRLGTSTSTDTYEN